MYVILVTKSDSEILVHCHGTVRKALHRCTSIYHMNHTDQIELYSRDVIVTDLLVNWPPSSRHFRCESRCPTYHMTLPPVWDMSGTMTRYGAYERLARVYYTEA